MKLTQQFAMLFFIFRHVDTYKPWNYNGSTPHLQELFTGRCWEYQLLDPVNREENLRVDVNCTEAWGLFRVAFASKNPCKNSTTANDYKMFFEKIKNTKHLSNKVRFKVFFLSTNTLYKISQPHVYCLFTLHAQKRTPTIHPSLLPFPRRCRAERPYVKALQIEKAKKFIFRQCFGPAHELLFMISHTLTLITSHLKTHLLGKLC